MRIFLRMCTFSNASKGKARPVWFDREKCFDVIHKECPRGELTVIFDGDPGTHFVSKKGVPIIQTNQGTEAKSFLFMLDHVKSLDLSPEEIVYFVEDDYLHKPGFSKILEQGFETGADYVTLYDHGDKYQPGYFQMHAPGFPLQMVTTKSTHWRTTPSTTNTYAMKFKTLLTDFDIHKRFSTGCDISDDHNKFLALWKGGRSLISCVPGYSTHCDYAGISPCVAWE